MQTNQTYEKSLDFAVRIVGLYQHLTTTRSEYVMSKQILRSGTSIGANISESMSAESTADFIHKLSISLKETRETIFWLTLLYRSQYLSDCQFQSMYDDCIQLKKILSSIILTTKKKMPNKNLASGEMKSEI